MISFLFVEVLLESRKLILLQDATLPPGFNKAEAIAHQLRKSGGDGKQAYLQTLVLNAGVNTDDTAIKYNR